MRIGLALALSIIAAPLLAQGRQVAEVEPNETLSTATRGAVGDTLMGVVNPRGDIDYFAFDVPAGVTLTITRRDARFPIDWLLLDPEGVFLAGWSADGQQGDPIRYSITVAGRYYLTMKGKENGGSPNHLYALELTSSPLTLGPGDPTRVVASRIYASRSSGVAAGPSGDLYFVAGFGVGHISPSGAMTHLFDHPYVMGGLALDETGSVLVPVVASQTGPKQVWRISPTGQQTVFVPAFTEDHEPPRSVVIGPDGDVWIGPAQRYTAPLTWRIWRTDGQGNAKDSLDISGVGSIRAMAFSPAGDLHFTANGGIYKLVNRVPQLVAPVAADAELGVLAFDRDGYLYVAAGSGGDVNHGPERWRGTVVLYDPAYKVVNRPFAHVPDIFAGLLFLRSSNGTTTARLLASQFGGGGGVVELNPAGIRAPGWPVGKQSGSPTATVAEITAALMGGPALSAEQVQYLDSHGNHNGVLDVGDLRAFLRTQGQLAGSKKQ